MSSVSSSISPRASHLPVRDLRDKCLASLLRRALPGAAVSLSLLALTTLSAPAVHAQTTSSPIVFGYTGFDQFYTVGAGVTQLQVQLFGAGGAGDAGGAFGGLPGFGGGGGYTLGTLNVTAGDILTLIVGQGGLGRNSAGNDAFSTYGGGGGDSDSGGGGRSGIRINDIINGSIGGSEVITAGGGGGGYNGFAGGAGGGLVGGNGFEAATGDDSFGGGIGGTQTAGGARSALGTAGTAFQGGMFANGGGGGGGGYFGGGAGISGGGGSSFVSSNAVASGTGQTFAGIGATSGGTNSADYQAGIGVGYSGTRTDTRFGDGGNGLIVIRTVSPAATTVPEPSTWAVMGMTGFALCGLMVRARRKAKQA